MHDKCLALNYNDLPPTAISYHWSLGASLMNQKLSHGFQHSDLDALWASAGLLGALGLSSIPAAQAPQEAWPLSSNTSVDLDWLKMCQGKRAIWSIANPMREDSISFLYDRFFKGGFFTAARPVAKLRSVWPDIMPLCKIGETETSENNAHLQSLFFLARTVGVECDSQNQGLFLSFFGSMHPDFKKLLVQKDPPSLLLLAYWYAKICYCRRWWKLPRASLECQAIFLYLIRCYGIDTSIMKALTYPEAILLAALS